ncbi:MAG TPA: DUF748 domain-containing protein [Puia sp.]|nr:DUF748 domain-containing protein [Puia sp.]
MVLGISKKLRRTLITVFAVLAAILFLVLFFLSTIVKYLIEKYSEKYTGRKITLAALHINVFDGVVRADGLRINEAKSDAAFFACREFYVNLTLFKLWSGKYEITELRLDHPVINVIQKGNHFNFDDLLKRFGESNGAPSKKSKPAAYRVTNFEIDSATVIYVNKSPYNKIEVIDWDTRIPLIASNDPVCRIHTDLSLQSGGKFDGDAVINADTYLYRARMALERYNISMLYPYLHDYLKVKKLEGLLSANLSFSGSIKKPQDLAASGSLNAVRLLVVDNTDEKLAAAEKIEARVDSINTKENRYDFQNLTITRPFLQLSMYNDGYNFERLMTTPASNATDTSKAAYANLFLMMADYLQSIIKEYVANNYNARQVRVEQGHFIFTDYTLQDKFQYDLDSLQIESDKISSRNNLITLEARSRLNKSGVMNGRMTVNPANFQDMDIDCTVSDMLISDFNPYSKYYVATPFLNGTAAYTNNTTILRRKLKSKNVVTIVKIEAGRKVKNKTAMNLPIRLAVALLKDVHGNINLEIPVTGSLDDPKFRWGKVVWQVLKNIVVKAATAPFRLFAHVFGGREEDYKEVNFAILQDSVMNEQQKILNNLANILRQKPDLKLELLSVDNLQDEVEAFAISEAKKLYAAADSNRQIGNPANIDDHDSLFNHFVESRLSSSSFMSIQEKCVQLIGREKCATAIREIENRRNFSVSGFFVQKQIGAGRLQITRSPEQADISRGQPPKYMINMAVRE